MPIYGKRASGKENGMPDLNDLTRRIPMPPWLRSKLHFKKPPKMRPGRTQSLLSAGFVLLMLGVIAFSVYQVARHVTVGLNTLRTQEILDRSYVSLELYVFRDEQPIYAVGSDTYLYTVADGGRAGVGHTLGSAYAVGNAEEAAALQQRLNAYGDRISLLRELGGLGTPSDARDAADAVDESYLGLLEAAGKGNLAAVEGYIGGMQDGLSRYDILTGAIGGQSVSSLEAERAALVAGLPLVSTVTTSRSGYFYYTCDGYESVFSYDLPMTMTAEQFKALTEQTAAHVPTGAVGKMVYQTTWYAAAYVPLSDAALEVFQQGIRDNTTYTMRVSDAAGTELDMTIVRMIPDEGGALVVFRSQDMPTGFDFPRSFTAETVSLEVSGYRIPTEAVVTLRSEKTGEDVRGVYILSGNVVEFRKINVHVARDGYIIATTYEDMKAYLDSLSEEEREKRQADGWSYLGLNDNIITSGNELYEGKVIG